MIGLKTNLIWNTDGHTDNQFEIKVNHEYITLCQNQENAHYGKVVDPNTREESNLWKNLAENSITKNGPANPFSKITLPAGFPVVSESGLISREVPSQEFFEEVGSLKYFPRNLIKKYKVTFPIKYSSAKYKNYKLTDGIVVCSGWANLKKLKTFIEGGCEPFDDGSGMLSFYLSEKGTIYYKKVKEGARNILSVLRNFSTTERMKYELEAMGLEFSYPKPKELINYLLRIGDSPSYLDFYAGSGTTGHAVIELNRQDNQGRKYILIEMGDEFDSVMLPRIIKSAYSKIWRDGTPISDRSGDFSSVSHLIKYQRLENYEDCLGNLALNRSTGQQKLLESSDSSPLNEARQSYVLNYMLDVETRESPSLLNTHQFLDPTQYQLKVRSASGDETKPVNVDLLETFNYLLGLTVEHIAAPIYFEAEHSQGEFGRWKAKVKRSDSGQWWFRTVFGVNRNGQKVLVVWRNLPSVIEGKTNGMQLDNAVLDAVLIEKLAIRLTESMDDEIDILYVNGDHNIAIPRNRQGEPMEQARIQLIEEAFHRLMFADTESVH